MASATWLPTVYTGDKAVMGSWKTMLMSPAAQFLEPRVALAERDDLERVHRLGCEIDRAADDPSGRLDDPHDAVGGHGFAGSGFADDGGNLAARHVESHIHQGMGEPQVRLEVDREIANLEDRVRHFAPAVL